MFRIQIISFTLNESSDLTLKFGLVSNSLAQQPIFSEQLIMHPACPCADFFRKGAYFLFISQQHNLGYGDKNAIKTSLPIRAA